MRKRRSFTQPFLTHFTPTHLHTRSRFSFTLIELMIVIAVAAILIAIVASSFSIIVGKRAEMQSRKLSSDLLWVRELSANKPSNISGENWYTVSFNCANRWYGIYAGNADATGSLLKQDILSVDNISATHPDAAGNVTSLSPAQLRFYSPSGTMVNATGTAFVTPRNKACINLQLGVARTQVKVYGNTGYVKPVLSNVDFATCD